MKITEGRVHATLSNLIPAVALLFFVFFLASCSSAGPTLWAVRIGDTFTVRGFWSGNVDNNQHPIVSPDGKITLEYGTLCRVNPKNKVTVRGISGDEVLLEYSTDDAEVLKNVGKDDLPPCFTGVVFSVSQEKYLKMKKLSVERENAAEAPQNPSNK